MPPDKIYLLFIKQVKQQILESRFQAAKLVNRELLSLYYSISTMIAEKVKKEKWGNAVIDNLSKDLQDQLPGVRGFSSKNIRNMRLFAEEYHMAPIWQSAIAKIDKGVIEDIFKSLSFTHHILLLNKCKDLKERFFLYGAGGDASLDSRYFATSYRY